MFVSWNELSAVLSRGFPIYIIKYRPTNSGTITTTTVSENHVIIENLSPNNAYIVSVAAAVREEEEMLMGPFSEDVEASPISSDSEL